MATDDRKDPYRGFNYLVNIEGTDVAGFSEMAGLCAEGDSADYREGANAENHVRKMVGLRKYTSLTFKRGYTKNDTLWRWYTNIANGKDDRRAVTVTLLNEEHRPVIHWNAEGAWINKVEGPSFAQELTNADLVAAIQKTEDWIANGGMISLDYDAYIIRQERLEGERQRRVGLGHVWLETTSENSCDSLVQTIPGEYGATDIVQVENQELIDGAATDITATPITTPGQFQGSVAGQGLPTVGVEEFLEAKKSESFGVADAGLDPNYGLSGAVSVSNVRGNHLQKPFSLSNANDRQGQIAEVYFGTSADSLYDFGVSDYNSKPWTHPTRGTEVGNYPVVDYRKLFGSSMPETSVKSSRSTATDRFQRFKTYMDGYAQMMNTDPGYRGFDHYINNSANGRTAPR